MIQEIATQIKEKEEPISITGPEVPRKNIDDRIIEKYSDLMS